MSSMEPDEGAKADDQRTEAPRWDKTEAANPPDDEGRRWPPADTDAESSDTDGSDASDVSSTDS
jgi:hypothetical protein